MLNLKIIHGFCLPIIVDYLQVISQQCDTCTTVHVQNMQKHVNAACAGFDMFGRPVNLCRNSTVTQRCRSKGMKIFKVPETMS